MTKIKICGITNYWDAKNAVDLGADFLGFNFHQKSPRYVDYKKAANIAKKLSGKAKLVGVFVNESVDNIKKIYELCDLDLIQLSGNETSDFVVDLKEKTNKKIMKCFHISNSSYTYNIKNFKFDYLMLDSFKKGFYGGTGKSFDLDIINGIDNKKLFLAGGLNASNVKQAIKKINPFAVDVCSGVESHAGKKDYTNLKKLIEAVK